MKWNLDCPSLLCRKCPGLNRRNRNPETEAYLSSVFVGPRPQEITWQNIRKKEQIRERALEIFRGASSESSAKCRSGSAQAGAKPGKSSAGTNSEAHQGLETGPAPSRQRGETLQYTEEIPGSISPQKWTKLSLVLRQLWIPLPKLKSKLRRTKLFSRNSNLKNS